MTSKIDEPLASLRLRERAARYHQLADEALSISTNIYDFAMRRDCLAMAAEWRILAEEAEKNIQEADAASFQSFGRRWKWAVSMRLSGGTSRRGRSGTQG